MLESKIESPKLEEVPMSHTVNLEKIMRYIGDRYVFIPDRYPGIKNFSDDQKRAFAISHSVHHMNKSIGRLSAECERFDHGGTMDETMLKETSFKILISSLKLIEELGYTAEDFAKAVPELVQNT